MTVKTTTPEATAAITNAVVANEGMVSVTEQVKFEPSNSAEPTPVTIEAISVDALGSLDDAKKAELGEFLSKVRTDAGATALNGMSRTDASLKRAISALVLERLVFPDKDWADEAKKRGVDTTKFKSKHKAAPSVYATFVVDIDKGTPEDRRNLGRNAERWCLAVEGAENRIKALLPDEQRKFTLDDRGFDHVANFIDEHGGINAIAASTRAENNKTPAERDHQIALDTAKASEYLVEAGRRALLDHAEGVTDKGATVTLALAAKMDGQTVVMEADAGLADAVLEQALKAQAPVDPIVDAVGEILQVGTMIEEVETDLPKDLLEDPTDKNTDKRLASRHIVFMPDGTMRVSTILNPHSPVVLVQTAQPVLAVWPTMPCHLQAQSRRRVEANIASPHRRKLFKMHVEEPGKTLGHCRLVFATAVAVEPKNGKAEVGVLVEPLRSKQENYPLDVRHEDFKPDWEFPLGGADRQLLVGFVSAIRSPGHKTITINMDGSEAEFVFGKTSQTLDAATPTRGKVSVMARHLRSALTTIADLPLVKDPKNPVTFAADREGAVRISFATKRATYAVFIPAVKGDETLSNRYFTPIKVG
ncbi:hypothetical protein [Devosia sp. CAU 1758]